MKFGDANSEIVGIIYSTKEDKEKFFKHFKELNVAVKEISFVSIEVPPLRKDEIVNDIKHFTLSWYWAGRNPLLHLPNFFGIKEMLFKQIEKYGYKQIKFDAESWKPDNRHELLMTRFCPLFYQDNSGLAETTKEKKAFDDLETFKSKGYKEIITGVVNENDMEMVQEP
jgi:hypothetical protein